MLAAATVALGLVLLWSLLAVLQLKLRVLLPLFLMLPVLVLMVVEVDVVERMLLLLLPRSLDALLPLLLPCRFHPHIDLARSSVSVGTQ